MPQRIEGIGSVVGLASHRSLRLRHLVLLVMWPSLGRDPVHTGARGSTQLPRWMTGALVRRRSAVVSLAWTAPASTVPARLAVFRSRALSASSPWTDISSRPPPEHGSPWLTTPRRSRPAA